MTRPLVPLALTCITLAGCHSGPAASAPPSTETRADIVPVSEVRWQQLNPARGDQSPQAGTLWGNRSGMVPTGFLAKFVDGFSSPPHLHNATYRAVVISGSIHNDDPDAAVMWMPPGSFWTQPAGEVHVTAANADNSVALVEIDAGPYLVLPTDQAFDDGERPINVHEDNLVWVDPPRDADAPKGTKIAYLWGQPSRGFDLGTFIRIPRESAISLESVGSVFRAVVISGRGTHAQDPGVTLEPGSYFGAEGPSAHTFRTQSDDCVLYVRSSGMYRISQ